MKTKQVDVAIIGAGTSGLSAYRAAKAHTDNIVMIEAGHYGTTCARVGCMPSKLLIAAADAAHVHRHSGIFGVSYDTPKIDGEAVLSRVRAERDRFVGFVIESVDEIPSEHKIKGYAKFVSDKQIQVGDDWLIDADRVVIATGSRPVVFPFMEPAGDRLLINDDVFELETLPKKVAVFGPGVIGLELGQALSRLGVEIKLFGVGGGFGPLRDEKVRDYAIEHFAKEFYLDVDAKVEEVSREGDQVVIRFHHASQGLVSESFDYLLAATGRRPNVDGIGLENTSLALTERGMPKFDPYTLQIEDSHIFIAGDANNHIPLLHEAADEGKIAGTNAGRFPEVLAGERRAPIGVVFSDPQMLSVGQNLQQLTAHCPDEFVVGEVSFENQGRSRVMNENVGLLRVYGEIGSGLFLGAEMVGPRAEHIAHLLAWSVQQRLTVSQMLAMPFYHPVIEEGVRSALRDLNHKLHLSVRAPKNCIDCGPGA